jgi:hypothetical protein
MNHDHGSRRRTVIVVMHDRWPVVAVLIVMHDVAMAMSMAVAVTALVVTAVGERRSGHRESGGEDSELLVHVRLLSRLSATAFHAPEPAK